MKILLAYFGPFGGESVNPAMEAALLLPDTVHGAEIIGLQVPVVFDKCVDTVMAAVNELRPDAVLCIGQAGGRAAITPERVAVNIDDASIPDNAGAQPIDTAIDPEGPAAYFSTLPVKDMVLAVKAAGIPASVSNTAGTFVCNHLMYGLLRRISLSGSDIPAGFMHVPYLDSQVSERPGVPSLSKEAAAAGIEAALGAIASWLSSRRA